MKEIALSKEGKNRGKYAALVDDDDYEWLNQWRWCAYEDRNITYAIRTYVDKDNRQSHTTSMHRQILGLTDPKIKCDHRDHDGLNNQRSNLRVATHAQNMANLRPRKNTTSKYKGVKAVEYKSESRHTINWHASMKINGACTHLGSFKTEEEAAIAYDEAAKIHHGEFANLNFPLLTTQPEFTK